MDNIEQNKIVYFKTKIKPNMNSIEKIDLFRNYFINKYNNELTNLYLSILINKDWISLEFINKRDLSIFLNNLFLVLNEISLNEEIYIKFKIKKEEYSFIDLTKPLKTIKEKFIFKNGFDNILNKNESDFFILKGRNFIRQLKNNFKNNFEEIVKNSEIFYDCNYPEEIDGYKIVEVDEDLYKYVKIESEKNIVDKNNNETNENNDNLKIETKQKEIDNFKEIIFQKFNRQVLNTWIPAEGYFDKCCLFISIEKGDKLSLAKKCKLENQIYLELKAEIEKSSFFNMIALI